MVRLKTAPTINPYASAAKSAAGGLIAAATGDLAVIRTQTRPRGLRPPIEYELHLNPAALGVAALGAGLTLWLLQLRMQPNLENEVITVVDIPAVAESGHWIEAIPAVWGEDIYGYKVQVSPPVPSQYVIDTPASAAITHQETTGKVLKTYSCEQRQGFTVGNLLGVSSAEPLGVGGQIISALTPGHPHGIGSFGGLKSIYHTLFGWTKKVKPIGSKGEWPF